MMRRVLLACTAAGAIIAATSQAARAQLTCLNCTEELTEISREVARVAQVGKQIAEAQATTQRLMATYQAITGVRDLGSAMSALGYLGLQNPLPVDPYALQNLISGAGGATGMSSALAGLYTGNAYANHVYTPADGDWQAQQMVTNANSLAGIQAVAQRSYQASAERLTQLAALRARAAVASDPAEVSQLAASTAIVQSDIASQQQQLQAVAQLAATQSQVRTQRDDEHERQCLDKLVAYFGGAAGDASCPMGNAGGAVMPAMATGNGAVAGSSDALNTMLGQSWGQQAAQNATDLGVNPTALASTCVMESGCQANPGGTGTVSGSFQMTDNTYLAAMRTAGAPTDLAGKLDPATQSIAASQELKTAALHLQAAGIANPTVLDTRALYQFGQGAGVSLARADDSQAMSSVLSGYNASVLQANGITPGVTTVGQWRAGITNKLGGAANQPVLLGLQST